MDKHTTIGMDIAKHVFHVVVIDAKGAQLERVKLKREQVLAHFAKRTRCLLGMEACGGAHYWGRELSALGFEVKLIAPRYVKAQVLGNKNDWADAAGIAQAATRANVPAVGVASREQQALQGLHRLRQRWMGERTRLINQMRGLLNEFGIVLPRSLAKARQQAASYAAPEASLPAPMRSLLDRVLEEWRTKDAQLAWVNKEISAQGAQSALARRLMSARGIGTLGASALQLKLANWQQFKHARHFAASLGLVPRHSGTGDKVHLGAISKRGDTYVRTLLIQGARAVYMQAHRRSDALSQWLLALAKRRGVHKAIVALANKNARIAYALARSEQTYDGARAAKAACALPSV